MKRVLLCFLTIAAVGFAQGKKAQASPPAETSVKIGGATITIKYHAPSVKGRTIWGPNGILAKDPIAPVWRAGANEATSLETTGDIMIGNLAVPAGKYTLFVLPDEGKWQLIVNKQTGQWGLEYHQEQDLGRVPMQMSKPPAMVETYKMTLTGSGNKGKLELAWENVAASVDITAK